MSQRPVVVGAVPLDMDVPYPLSNLRPGPGPFIFLTVRTTVGVVATGGLQKCVVWNRECLVQQSVQGLLVDACLWELYLMQSKWPVYECKVKVKVGLHSFKACMLKSLFSCVHVFWIVFCRAPNMFGPALTVASDTWRRLEHCKI